ncbi:MAG: radical SAM family heme chaperone HemW [Prolixibacteraceae bacterium]|nr:radical SAM family heme chaperone HemW [Prolixibacteraceae bacterium]
MAGIYIHIPFCRQKCHYCDFYKTTDADKKENYIKALSREILLRKDYLAGENVETVYLGGGTPSLLSNNDFQSIFGLLQRHFNICFNAEITIEVNPDDLNIICLKEMRNFGVNRLSIGVQAFQDTHLKKMNRRHTANQAYDSVLDAQNAGFTNIGVDLIYGIPGLIPAEWQSNLLKVFSLPVTHLSAYHLTWHRGTVFYNWLKRGKIKEVTEDDSVAQYNILTEMTASAGFGQYEISNFARKGFCSRHNTSYWTGKNYLGLGPSAHSYNGTSRSWNVSSLEKYILALENGKSFFTNEDLSFNDHYNEYLLTNLRTKWGVSGSFIAQRFGNERAELFYKLIQKYLSVNKIIENNDQFFISGEGLFTSDDIIAGLMII